MIQARPHSEWPSRGLPSGPPEELPVWGADHVVDGGHCAADAAAECALDTAMPELARAGPYTVHTSQHPRESNPGLARLLRTCHP